MTPKLATKTKERPTINLAGGKAFEFKNDADKLVASVSAYLFGEKLNYENPNETITRIFKDCEGVAKTEPEFILKLAAYVRNELNLRTVSVALLAKAANIPVCKKYVRKYAPLIIKRADEINEVIAAYTSLFPGKSVVKEGRSRHINKKFPNSLKKAIKDAFVRFNEFQIAKYNRAGAAVKFKDAIMLSHASKPSDLIKKILDGKLATPETWETEISGKGSTKENWLNILPKMGHMAALRNINNFLKNGIGPSHFLEKISGKDQVLKGKQLPFRYYSAYKNVHEGTTAQVAKVREALSKALQHSIANLPQLNGKTCICIDTSGSMTSSISEKSNMQLVEIAALMGSITNEMSKDNIVYCFDDKLYKKKLNKDTVLENTEYLMKRAYGGGTDAHLCIEELHNKNIDVNRVIMFTDMQIYGENEWAGNLSSSWKEYVKTHPNAKLYVVNLCSYGSDSPVEIDGKNNAMVITGWSEQILKFISNTEMSQVDYIRVKYQEGAVAQ